MARVFLAGHRKEAHIFREFPLFGSGLFSRTPEGSTHFSESPLFGSGFFSRTPEGNPFFGRSAAQKKVGEFVSREPKAAVCEAKAAVWRFWLGGPEERMDGVDLKPFTRNLPFA